MDPSKFFTLTAESELDEKIELSLAISPSPTLSGEIKNKTEENMGWRFEPRDDEVMVYLKRKLEQSNFRYYRIPDLDVYKFHPKDIFAYYRPKDGDTCYFFCPRNLTNQDASRPSRTAEGGTWKITGAESYVLDPDGKEVGLKKGLKFMEGTPLDSTNTDWLMKEYRDLSATEDDTYVLCKIYYNSDKLWPSVNLPPGFPMHEPEKHAKDISLGWQFSPTNEELLYYLKKKNRDREYACSYITDADVYAYHPEDLVALNKSKRVKTWYFFNSKESSKFGIRRKRGTDRGYWDVNHLAPPILDLAKKQIGEKRHFYYKEGKCPNVKSTKWTMIEYHSWDSDQANSWMVCKVYKIQKVQK